MITFDNNQKTGTLAGIFFPLLHSRFHYGYLSISNLELQLNGKK